jgi:hypothetical protein
VISLTQRRKDKSLSQFSFPKLVNWSDSSITTLRTICVFIASITLLFTFVGNLVSAQNIIMDISWLGDITESESEETEDEENEPSESLTLEGLSPQGESDLAIACSLNPEGC